MKFLNLSILLLITVYVTGSLLKRRLDVWNKQSYLKTYRKAYSSNSHGNTEVKCASTMTYSLIDKLLLHGFRSRPVKAFLSDEFRASLFRFIDEGIIKPPKNKSYFIPEFYFNSVECILKNEAEEQQEHFKGPVTHLYNTLALSRPLWSDKESHEKGEIFERMHISWLLAMRSHEACQTFLFPSAELMNKEISHYLLQYLIGPKQNLPKISKILDSLPKGTLTASHNRIAPNSKSIDEPFLLHGKYSVLQIPKRCSNSFEHLMELTDSELIHILVGMTAVKNAEYGAGYDFLIADWIPDGQDKFKIYLTFFEMRFSHSNSTSVETLQSICRKHSIVKDIFEKLSQRLKKLTNISIDYRLVMECFRKLGHNFDANLLPQKVFLYEQRALASAYGPTIAKQASFKNFD